MAIKDKFHSKCPICKSRKDFVFPSELIDSIHDIVLFVGSGVSTENRLTFPDTFYDTICNELNIRKNSGISFSKVMSMYCKKYNSKHQLINKIKERLDYFKLWPELHRKATEFHREFSLFPCITNVITTNWDDFFELETHAIPFVYDKDLVFWDQAGKKVLKIHGSINNPSSIIATEEDYKQCYKNLHKGNIGSQIKLFLSKNTVVFIGYSFQDEDFQKIYNFIKNKMGAFKKQAYIVTTDKKSDSKWKKLKLAPIYTSGSYFIHKWRKEFEHKGCISPIERLDEAIIVKQILHKEHEKTAKKYKITKYPEVIYCLCYQDGVIHAIEYMLNRVDYGYTLCIENVHNAIESYERLVKKYRKHKNWIDHSYLKGYLRGLYIILVCMKNVENRMKQFTQRYYYNAVYKEEYFNEKEFKNSLKKRKTSSEIIKFAKKHIKKTGGDDTLVYHHIPRL
jgi:NAD-dependent SIR2 family protein deacetylase